MAGSVIKGQGAPERLGAFMAQVEAYLDGDVPDGEDTAGAYALFDDVPRAYGQVWRDGLCLALYSISYRARVMHSTSSELAVLVTSSSTSILPRRS